MTTITDIRDDLVSVFQELRAGKIDRADASELANVSGKIISALKVQIAYHALRGEAPDIPFLAAPVQPPQRLHAQSTDSACELSGVDRSAIRPVSQ